MKQNRLHQPMNHRSPSVSFTNSNDEKDQNIIQADELLSELESVQKKKEILKQQAKEQLEQELEDTELKFRQYLHTKKEDQAQGGILSDIKLTDGNLEIMQNAQIHKLQMGIKNNPNLSDQIKRKRLMQLAEQKNQMSVHMILEKAKGRQMAKHESNRNNKFQKKMKIFKSLNTFLQAKGFLQSMNDLNEQEKGKLKSVYKRIKMNEVFSNNNKKAMDIFLKNETNSPTKVGGLSLNDDEENEEQYEENMIGHFELLHKCSQIIANYDSRREVEIKLLDLLLVQLEQKESYTSIGKQQADIEYQSRNVFFQYLNGILFPDDLNQVDRDIQNELLAKLEQAGTEIPQKKHRSSVSQTIDVIQQNEIEKLKLLIESQQNQTQFNHDDKQNSQSKIDQIKEKEKFIQYQKQALRILKILAQTSKNIYNKPLLNILLYLSFTIQFSMNEPHKNILQVAGTKEFMKVAQSVKKKEEMENQIYNNQLEIYKQIGSYKKSDQRVETLEMYKQYRLMALSPEEITGRKIANPSSPLKSKESQLNISFTYPNRLSSNAIITEQEQQKKPIEQENKIKLPNPQSPPKILKREAEKIRYGENPDRLKIKQSSSFQSLREQKLESQLITFIDESHPSSVDILSFLNDSKNQHMKDFYLYSNTTQNKQVQSIQKFQSVENSKERTQLSSDSTPQEQQENQKKPMFSIQQQAIVASSQQDMPQIQVSFSAHHNSQDFLNFTENSARSPITTKLPSLTDREPRTNQSKSTISYSRDFRQCENFSEATSLLDLSKTIQTTKQDNQFFLLKKQSNLRNRREVIDTEASYNNNNTSINLDYPTQFINEVSSRIPSPIVKKQNILTVTQHQAPQIESSPTNSRRSSLVDLKKPLKPNFNQNHIMQLGAIIEDLEYEKRNFKYQKLNMMEQINNIENQYQKQYDQLHQNQHLESLRLIQNSDQNLDRLQRGQHINKRALKLIL